MVVLKLIQRDDHAGTVAVLSALLVKARRGELRGIALSYRTVDDREAAVYTGLYRAAPAEAVRAGLRMSWRLTQDHDMRLSSPPSV